MRARLLRMPAEQLAIGEGLAAWAFVFVRPTVARAPRRPWRYWLLRFPLELLAALIEGLADMVGAIVLDAIRIDDRGHVHVRNRYVAIICGALIALLAVAFQGVAVYYYNAGVADGMVAQARTRWR